MKDRRNKILASLAMSVICAITAFGADKKIIVGF